MRMKFGKGKRRALIGTIVAILVGSATAFAYFTTTGAGTGSAQTGTAANLTISQIGPGYDSLIAGSGDNYQQDQCFECAGPISELGNEINLATTGRLVDVVVAMRNWGPAIASLPVTLSLYNAPANGTLAQDPGVGSGDVIGGVASVTQNFAIPAATTVGSTPTAFTIAFDFSSLDLTLHGPVVYGISFSPASAPSLNVALSSSTTNLSVGSDEYPGYVYVNTASDAGWDSDAGTCGNPLVNSFVATNVWCSDVPADNYGAYGNGLNADIPAVEFNVVGGSPLLYPGTPAQPLEYAITNTTGGPAHVASVSASVPADNFGNILSGGTPVSGCKASWYQINGSAQTLGIDIPSGVTFFDTAAPHGSTLSIQMLDDGAPDQNPCQGKSLDLSFSSN